MNAQNRPDISLSNVVALHDLVDYQQGAVVSRTLLKKSTGTVTLFAFDQGEGLSEHTAPANRPHAVCAVTPFKMLLIMVRS